MSITTTDQLKAIQEKFSSALVVLVFTDSEKPSEYTKDLLQELQCDYPDESAFKIVSVDTAEDVAGLVDSFSVNEAPTVVILRGFKILAKVEGFDAHAIVDGITRAMDGPVAPPAKKTLKERLVELIGSHRFMLFMKGSPDAPRCGFSRQTIELLRGQGIEFGSFDILSDDEVRQGLKEYSDWPTYPQFYANSELIGGLDVLKELVADGSFKEALSIQ